MFRPREELELVLSLVVPWIPCSKKNETVCQRIEDKARKRIHWRPGPTKRAVAHELGLAIAVLAAEAVAAKRLEVEEALLELGIIRQHLESPCWRGRTKHDAHERRARLAALRQHREVFALRGRATPRPGLFRLEVEEVIGPKKGTDRVHVRLYRLPPYSRKRRTGSGHDLVNVPAIVCDALQGSAIEDDAQISELEVRRRLEGGIG